MQKKCRIARDGARTACHCGSSAPTPPDLRRTADVLPVARACRHFAVAAHHGVIAVRQSTKRKALRGGTTCHLPAKGGVGETDSKRWSIGQPFVCNEPRFLTLTPQNEHTTLYILAAVSPGTVDGSFALKSARDFGCTGSARPAHATTTGVCTSEYEAIVRRLQITVVVCAQVARAIVLQGTDPTSSTSRTSRCQNASRWSFEMQPHLSEHSKFSCFSCRQMAECSFSENVQRTLCRAHGRIQAGRTEFRTVQRSSLSFSSGRLDCDAWTATRPVRRGCILVRPRSWGRLWLTATFERRKWGSSAVPRLV